MTKKILMACASLVAFAALALPAVASASPELTDPSGSTVLPGKLITGTQIGTSRMTATDGNSTLLECTKGTMTGELTKNNGTEIEGDIWTAIFSGTGGAKSGEPAETTECTGGAGSFGNAAITAVVSQANPWCLKSIPTHKFTVRGGSCTGASSNIKFIMSTTLVGACEYESTSHLVGSFTTGSDILKLENVAHSTGATENGFKRIAGSIFCPSSGSLDMEFTLETDTTHVTPITIS